jgi:hypothetical protein
MRSVVRLLLIVVVGLGLCVGVTRVVASDERSDGRSLPSWLLAELRRSEVLERRVHVMSHVLQSKRAIVTELLAEKLTAREAIDQFIAVDEESEEESPGLLRSHSRPLTEKRLEQQLIGWVKTELGEDSPRTEEVVHRLEEELCEQPSATE